MIHKQCSQLCPQDFWIYIPKMTCWWRAELLCFYRVLFVSPSLMISPFPVEIALLESSVNSGHLCFEDFLSYLHDIFVEIQRFSISSLPLSFSSLLFFLLSYSLYFPFSHWTFLEKKNVIRSRPFLLENLGFYAHSFYGSYENSHSPMFLSVFVLVRFVDFLQLWTCIVF